MRELSTSAVLIAALEVDWENYGPANSATIARAATTALAQRELMKNFLRRYPAFELSP